MDRYLNIFYSYVQGGFEGIDEERVLEDNVTRALITTLMYSEPSLTVAFLRTFLNHHAKRDKFDFELQNIDDDDSWHSSIELRRSISWYFPFWEETAPELIGAESRSTYYPA